MWIWFSTARMTVGVEVDHNGVIVGTPPIIRRFRGQRAIQLERWLRRQPGFRMEYINDRREAETSDSEL